MKNRRLYVGSLLLAAAVAVTALTCLPTSARANSSDKVYRLAPTGLKSDGGEPTPKAAAPTRSPRASQPTPKAHITATPKTGEEGSAEMSTDSEGEPGSKDRPERRAAALGNGRGHPPGGGKEGGSSKPPDSSGHTDTTRQVRAPTRPQPSPSAGGGASSPVVPILIVVTVLAALSIGTVLYRGRRQDPRPSGYGGNSA
jgi:hypothetical protein